MVVDDNQGGRVSGNSRLGRGLGDTKESGGDHGAESIVDLCVSTAYSLTKCVARSCAPATLCALFWCESGAVGSSVKKSYRYLLATIYLLATRGRDASTHGIIALTSHRSNGPTGGLSLRVLLGLHIITTLHAAASSLLARQKQQHHHAKHTTNQPAANKVRDAVQNAQRACNACLVGWSADNLETEHFTTVHCF